jgi:uncharacterized 2Fe-2S/4Fe-4S cluster protein (DUF4445 family)
MTQKKKYHISFDPVGKSTDVLPGASLLESAWMAGISIASVCGGNGTCGQCRVIINHGDTSPPKPEEKKLLTEEELEKGYRLACCTYPQSDLKVHILEKSMVTGVRLQLESRLTDMTVDPMIRAYNVKVDQATLEDPRADMNRIMDAFSNSHGLHDVKADVAVVRQLSSLLRKFGWQTTACLRSGEIIGFLPLGSHPVGLAVDIGTTKIAAYLLDLITGEELASSGAVNPQTMHGEDIMSRLYYTIQNAKSAEPAPELSTLICEKLDELLAELIGKAGLSHSQVADICVAGNTAMTHLLLDLPVQQLASSPYVASTNSAMDVMVRDLGIQASPGSYVHVLPGIGGFVGADHVAMILATDIDRKQGVTIGVDIGTNTEIVISKNNGADLVSVASPSGPAFEGAHVADGMRAAEGAIESVKLTESGVDYTTIGDAPAIGLCGSGIIDAVSELYLWDLIDARGRFRKTHSRVKRGSHGSEFQLAADPGRSTGNSIVVTQRDIDEIQLAKGAIRAGIDVLLNVTDTPPEAVAEVIIAGAFGSFINLINTINIGMIPYFPNAKYRQVGNAAGVGAKMALISRAERDRARDIANRTRYVELTTYPGFNRLFALGMMFPEEGQKIDQDKINKE